jgi:hypothetical protein
MSSARVSDRNSRGKMASQLAAAELPMGWICNNFRALQLSYKAVGSAARPWHLVLLASLPAAYH